MAIKTITIGGREIRVDSSISDRLLAANNDKITATGSPIQINEAFRTTERQAELFAKSQAGEIGRAAPPGQSFHETGKAVDIADFEDSQRYLQRYGISNDLADDKGHFSIDETRVNKFSGLANNIERGRQQGLTDTELLNSLVRKNKEFATGVANSRRNFATDPKIKNDRDLINFLALKFSGVAKLQTPSNAGEQRVDQGILKETGIDIIEAVKGAEDSLERRVARFGDIFKKTASGEITPLGTGLQSVGNFAGLISDIAGDAFIGLGKVLLSQDVEDSVKEKFVNLIEVSGAGEALQKGQEGWDKFHEKFPETADNLAALGSIGEAALDIFGAGGAGKIGSKAIKEAADIVSEGAEFTVKQGRKVVPKITEGAKFGVSQSTGLTPDTIELIVKNPKLFTKRAMDAVDRESFAKTALGKINERVRALSDAGKGYTAIRESAANVVLDKDWLQNTLEKNFSFKIVDNKIESTTKSATRNSSDIKALQDVVDNWGDKIVMDADEFLNFRADLSDLARFDAAKTPASAKIGRDLRQELNSKYRGQIDGLEKLDDLYSAEKKTLDGIKKDYFKRDGTLKDNAVSKLANLTGKGKEQVLERLKALIPDVESQVNILKAIENIKAATGIQVGAYAKSFSGLIGLGGVVTGNVPAVVFALLSNPTIAVELLKAFGKLKGISKDIIDGIVNSMKKGEKLTGVQATVFKDMLSEKSAGFKKIVDDIKKNEK